MKSDLRFSFVCDDAFVPLFLSHVSFVLRGAAAFCRGSPPFLWSSIGWAHAPVNRTTSMAQQAFVLQAVKTI
ncbi:MAG: hypothetical protein ACOX0U_05850 [Oscillospiraceae bacterium]|jgi:hypothetical protein